MLEVINLTKIFNIKRKEEKVALDKVSFKLPETGFAFIVGKSGSGKTTLLSLIGGLEDITSGEIIYHGNKLSEFKHNEFDVYRNNEVGFIFQDYHLLEELTIFDNIKMMLDFKNIKDDFKIHEALENVGLKGYENRYPKELSGGEKQRVAIARILVKDPSIILADEPTGNLDRKTTEQILKLLQKISKEKLVIIVSHNKYDARDFADFIFELDDGKIKNKYIKSTQNKSNFRVENGTLFLSKDRHISKTEIDELKQDFKITKISDIKQNKSEFIEFDEDIEEKNKIFKNKKNHISFFNSLKYSFKYFKKGITKSAIISAIFGIVISVATLCFSIANIDTDYLTTNFLKENKKTAFKISDSETFKFINDDLYEDSKKIVKPENFHEGYEYLNPVQNIFIPGLNYDAYNRACKTLVYKVDEEYLEKTFGTNGKLEFYGRRNEDLKDGVYVTDGFIYNICGYQIADENLDKLVELGIHNQNTNININGIINTHIKERHQKVFENIDHLNLDNTKNLSDEENKLVIDFLNENYLYHSGLYTFNENFHDDFIDLNTTFKTGLSVAKYQGRQVHLEYNFFENNKLKDNEIIIRRDSFERLVKPDFDVYTTDLDKPYEITVDIYSENDNSLKDKLDTKVFKIVGLTNGYQFANKNTIRSILELQNKPVSLLLEDVKDIDDIINLYKKYDIKTSIIEELSIEKIDILVSSLRDFFMFIFYIIAIVLIVAVVLYFIKSFNNKLFEIGVMKALGARDKDVINMMLIEFLATIIFVMIVFMCFEIPLVLFSNSVLIHGIKNVSDINLLSSNLKILYIEPLKLFINNLFICVIFFIAFIFQFIRIRKLKPVNIIKAKE